MVWSFMWTLSVYLHTMCYELRQWRPRQVPWVLGHEDVGAISTPWKIGITVNLNLEPSWDGCPSGYNFSPAFDQLHSV